MSQCCMHPLVSAAACPNLAPHCRRAVLGERPASVCLSRWPLSWGKLRAGTAGVSLRAAVSSGSRPVGGAHQPLQPFPQRLPPAAASSCPRHLCCTLLLHLHSTPHRAIKVLGMVMLLAISKLFARGAANLAIRLSCRDMHLEATTAALVLCLHQQQSSASPSQCCVCLPALTMGMCCLFVRDSLPCSAR